jgi:hypothetical protein
MQRDMALSFFRRPLLARPAKVTRFGMASRQLCQLIALFALAAPASADSLIDNVNGLTLTRDGRVERFTGLLIGPDGKVKKLLSRGDKRPDRGLDFRHDGKGRVLMPGLIDAHGHVMGLGLKAMSLDLTSARTLAEAQAMIAAYAKANPDRGWIIGSGWNQEQWGLGRFPTAADIDAVVPDRPVWLERVDGHASWANSAAIRAAKARRRASSWMRRPSWSSGSSPRPSRGSATSRSPAPRRSCSATASRPLPIWGPRSKTGTSSAAQATRVS